MARRGQRFRRPASTCFAFLGWEATAETIKSGKREVRPGSYGVVELIFRRKYPRYRYICKRSLLKYSDWLEWAESSSPGSIWNEQYKGNI